MVKTVDVAGYLYAKRMLKTYNSGDSPVVTHLTTSPPVKGLTCGERTGSSVLLNLWSYVKECEPSCCYIVSI
jgi:hypothetical protein